MRRLLIFLLCSTCVISQSKISDNQLRTPPPLQCSDTTTSGTTQTCTTAPSFTPAAKDCVTYNTTTTNTGALTLNVNSQGAKAVQKWLGTALVAGDVVANKPQLACYDGTNWQLSTIGNAPTSLSTPVSVANGGTGASTLTVHGVVIGNTTTAVNITSAGTSGQVLTSNGASSDPTFQAAAGGLTQLSTQTLGAGVSNITFSSISASYSSLEIIFNGQQANGGNTDVGIQFNGDTAGNYDYAFSFNSGGGFPTGQTSAHFCAVPQTSGSIVAGSATIIIPNYATTTFQKSFSSTCAAGNSGIGTYGGSWHSTAAINAIKIIVVGGANFATGTVATLYGVQ